MKLKLSSALQFRRQPSLEVYPARQTRLGTVAVGATRVHVSKLENQVTHDTLWLTSPLNGGGFSNFRLARGRRVFGVKELYLPDDGPLPQAPGTHPRHKRDTRVDEFKHERQMLELAHSEARFERVWQDGNRLFCFMKYMRGDLYDAVTSPPWSKAAAGPLAIDALADVAIQLAYDHARGMIHGDIKLENVLWNERAHFVLTDFGGAHLVNECVERPTYTPQYASPEKLGGEASGRPADVWALGILALQILCQHRHPLLISRDAETAEAQSASIKRKITAFSAWHCAYFGSPMASGRPVTRNRALDRFAGDLQSTYPKGLMDLVLKDMLNPDPKQRPSAAQVAEAARRMRLSGKLHRIMRRSPTRQFLVQAAQSAKNRHLRDAVKALEDVAAHR
ncbi:MAG TPA: protein kinase, partial [Myxococcota bacterium]|nr:protein kinase [Myxococcota bacterium]